MSVVAIDDIVSINYDGLYLNQQIIFTTCWKIGGTLPSPANLDAFYTEVRATLGEIGGIDDCFAGCFIPAFSGIKTVIQKIYPARYRRSVALSNTPAGTLAQVGEGMPPNVAASFVLHADLTGPSDKGTKHVLVTDSADVENGIIQVRLRDALIPLGNKLKGNLGLGGTFAGCQLIPIIFRRSAPTLSSGISEAHVMSTSRVLRRRTVGQGT